jgi:Tfp pilus assembly protein PilP
MNNISFNTPSPEPDSGRSNGKRQVSFALFLLPWIVLMIALLCGCQHNSGNDLESLRAEVMAIHDEAMARMGEMHEREVTLRTRADALQAAGQPADAERNAAAQLQQAQRAMMEWMHQYKQPDMKGDRQQVESYLHTQKEKINNVRELITAALQETAALSSSQ